MRRPRVLLSVPRERWRTLGKASDFSRKLRDPGSLLPTEELLGQNMTLEMPEGYENAPVVVNTYPVHSKVKAKKESP